MDNGWNIIFGGNVKLDAATVYGKVAFFDNVVAPGELGGLPEFFSLMKEEYSLDAGWKGWGAELGVKVPVGGGDLMAGLGYRQSEVADYAEYESELWTLNVGYAYALSKRTSLYGAVGYAQDEFTTGPDETYKAKVWQAGVGLVHKF